VEERFLPADTLCKNTVGARRLQTLCVAAVTALLFCGCAKQSREARIEGPSGVIVLSHLPSRDARCEAGKPSRVFLRVNGDDEGGLVAKSAMPDAALGYVDESGKPVTVPMIFDGETGALAAPVPAYPKWAKISYYFVVWNNGAKSLMFLPSNAPDVTFNTVARGKLPGWLLVAHLAAMFVALALFLISAIAGAASVKTGRFPVAGLKAATAGLVMLVIGGFALGCVCAYLTFGTPWTGFPVGKDITDNKTLLILVYWTVLVGACKFGLFGRPNETTGAGPRLAGIMIAGLVASTVLYLVKHSI
jgi:hypothetical protein